MWEEENQIQYIQKQKPKSTTKKRKQSKRRGVLNCPPFWSNKTHLTHTQSCFLIYPSATHLIIPIFIASLCLNYCVFMWAFWAFFTLITNYFLRKFFVTNLQETSRLLTLLFFLCCPSFIFLLSSCQTHPFLSLSLQYLWDYLLFFNLFFLRSERIDQDDEKGCFRFISLWFLWRC